MTSYLLMIVLVAATPLLAFAQTDEEYKVYDAVIWNMFSGKTSDDVDTGKMPKQLVIKEGIYFDESMGSYVGGKEPATKEDIEKSLGIPYSIYADFSSNCKIGGKLSRAFDPKLRYVIVSDDKISSFFRDQSLENDWQAYYKQYPDSDGFIGFSRVGFNNSKTVAFLYFQQSCGSLCASGYYLILDKKDKKWLVRKRQMLWIS